MPAKVDQAPAAMHAMAGRSREGCQYCWYPFRRPARTTRDKRGEPWFVVADVCAALSLDDTSKAVSRLDDEERGTGTVRTPSGFQQMLVINESGLYSLILTSR